MRHSRVILASLAAAFLCGPALADERRDAPPLRFEPEAVFHGILRESDVALLFDYLRASMAAAALGTEAPPPEELEKRAQALGSEFRMRGALAALALLNQLEAAARERLREPAPRRLPPPPTRLPDSPAGN